MRPKPIDLGGASPLEGVELVLADLDGVVYAGSGAIPHAVDALTGIRHAARVAYLTNNASRTDVAVAEHLGQLGLDVSPDEVVTSPQAAVQLLAQKLEPGSTVLVVGGDGLSTVVADAGFRVVASEADGPVAVVQGFHPSVGWTQLAEASYTLQRGEHILWVATNTDWTIPQARGTAPGNGTLVSAVHTATGRLPIVAGKPERAIFDTALARFGANGAPVDPARALMIGDRLDTDILGANRVGIPSALVLTGIDRAKQLLPAPAEQRPDYILGDLRELALPYPHPVETTDRRGVRRFAVRNAVVSVAGAQVRLDKAGDATDIVRAGAAAVWASGAAIYALDVDPRLYSDA